MFNQTLKSLFVSGAAIALMGGPSFADSLIFDGRNWSVEEFDGSETRIETYLGREALFLKRNFSVLEGESFGDMVIEYEYASTHPSGFIGVNFRADPETNNLEQFYTRPHQSGQPDATQYMVMTNGLATWQLHAGPNEAVATDLPPETWIKVKIVAIGDQADIFVHDMEEPLIHVADLRSTSQSGAFSLYASDRPWRSDTGAYFSNVNVRAATPEDQIIGTSAETEPAPAGLIEQFEVSRPFEEAKISDAYALPSLDVMTEPWTDLSVENDGVANIGRTTALKDGKNTALVRFKVDAETASTRMLQFGYSDRVRLYVGGKLVYAGNARWRARDHRFLGTVALVDQIALHLEPGETEIVAAVSESFGGWGFKAALSEE